MHGQNDVNQVEENNELTDRISQLPDHVIHHIFSHFRNVKDAVRTSVLSKRWRSLWYSFSTLIFDERRFAAGIGQEDSTSKEKMFRDYVSSTLQIHLAKNVGLQKLLLHMNSCDTEAARLMDHWLSVARAENIKELDLRVGIKKGTRYTLPQTVFSTETMTGLRLSGCKLQTCYNIMLPHLQKLYLRKLHLDDNVIHNLISSCLSIVDLRFIQCSGLKCLQVSNLLQLNRAEIHHCNQLKKVELSAPNLHTFWYCGRKSKPCKVSLVGCNSLKRLTLEHPQVTGDFFENRFSDFPLLEKLDLNLSDKRGFISISSPKLQRLSLKGRRLGFLLVNAPKLVSFEYKGETMPFIEIDPFCLTDAKLSFESKRKANVGYDGHKLFFMTEFIKKFDPDGLKVVVHSNKNIVILENLNDIILPPLPDVCVEINKSSACIEESLYSLLRTLHPVSLSIISPFDSNLLKLLFEMIKIKGEDPTCCKYNTLNNKCWRHFLKDIKIEDVKDLKIDDTGACEDKRTLDWCNWFESSTTLPLGCQMNNMSLCWDSLHQSGADT